MFVGSVPMPVIRQLLHVVPLGEWKAVYVCCSGSFRVDRAIKHNFPGLPVYGNDVSLYSCGLGALARGEEFHIGFKGRLEWIEELPIGTALVERLAAVAVALEMGRYIGKSRHAFEHFQHFSANFMEHWSVAREQLVEFRDSTQLDGFFAGDFREHARRALQVGAGIVAFPPTYKGGYERLYRFVDESTEWPRPAYEVWDPAMLPAWVEELRAAGASYCVLWDGVMPEQQPVARYYSGTNKPVFLYADRGKGAVRRERKNSAPFSYRPIDLTRIGVESKVQLVAATSQQMNFLKDVYLAKNIAHVAGEQNFIVLIDGMLAGGFIYKHDKTGQRDVIYLQSDFAIARGRKLAKLIALLATSKEAVTKYELAHLVFVKGVRTTAFTNKPVSMKYRGIYTLVARSEGRLSYWSEVREQTTQELYGQWWRRWAQDGDQERRSENAAAS